MKGWPNEHDTINRTDTPLISKSRFLAGLQCKKLLWTMSNAKRLIPEPDAQAQAVFNQGNEVGELAKRLFTNSIEINQETHDYDDLIRLTQEAVKARKPLFEAAFCYQGGYARADVLDPVDGDSWDLIEVKSSTSIKDVYIFDLAFQAFVIAGTGMKIRHCFLLLIDPDFIRRGEIDPGKFFARHNVTVQVATVSCGIETKLDEMLGIIRLENQPDIKIGPHCDNPYSCPLHDECWSFLPDDNVLKLYRGAKKGFKLLANGINRIKDIPQGFPLTNNQKIQREVAITGQPHVSKAAMSAFLRRLEYPVSYLDFETFSTALPLFDDCRPFEQVPFQFSLHIVRSPDCQPEHCAFLAEGSADPRHAFLDHLRECLPDSGSIVVYNQHFEQTRLRECCQLYPEFQTWLSGVEARFLDLLKPFRAFRYYGPGQNGSASMKAVLPVLTGRGYDHLAIQEGGTASLEFLRVHFSDVPELERQRVRQALQEYCGKDTFGMIEIVSALRNLVCE